MRDRKCPCENCSGCPIIDLAAAGRRRIRRGVRTSARRRIIGGLPLPGAVSGENGRHQPEGHSDEPARRTISRQPPPVTPSVVMRRRSVALAAPTPFGSLPPLNPPVQRKLLTSASLLKVVEPDDAGAADARLPVLFRVACRAGGGGACSACNTQLWWGTGRGLTPARPLEMRRPIRQKQSEILDVSC